jgi:outer membrane lipoprotein-sorting protein
VQANEKKFIIDRFLEIDNFSFDFDQISNKKVETGNCLLKFDNKLRCKYNNKLQKEIIIDNKKLVILQKRYNKIYYYPVSKSPFINILSKKKLINLIKNSDLVLNDNIELIYLDENQKKITVFFEKKNYNLIGWLVEDSFQNEVYFSLRINETNIEINKNYFKIPKIN